MSDRTVSSPRDDSAAPVRSWAFVTRKFPPAVGGMETLAAGVWQALAELDGSRLVVHRGTNRSLPAFLPRALATTRRLLRTGRSDAVLASDALMYTALLPVLPRDVPRVTLVHGLDLTYPRRPYQALLRSSLPTADLVLANSHTTAALAAEAGADPARVVVIPLGLPAPPDHLPREQARALLCEDFDIPVGASILGTVGRLVPRKGVRWLIDEVLPKTRSRPTLVVAGVGPDRPRIEESARHVAGSANVRVLGAVSDRQRDLLMSGADLFVQPNIVVPNDIEGFGLVTVEAAMRGAVVVASDIEGLRDAVVPDTTGYVLPAGDATEWIDTVDRLLAAPVELARTAHRFEQEARRLYSQDRMAQHLLAGLAAAEASYA